jgi:LacI family transcriptional regulator
MPDRSTIAVVIPTHMTCFRDLLRGINAFAHAKATWRLHFLREDNYVQFISRYKPDGLLIGALSDYGQGKQAIARVSRCVGVVGGYRHHSIDKIVAVESDDERVGEVAAQHFIQKGYRDFAFVGQDAWWSLKRAAGFERELKKAGFLYAFLRQEWESTITSQGWDHVDRAGKFATWLRALPRPLALMGCNDVHARMITEVCRDEGIRVPDDVAILGVDNDDLDCEISDPPLSSVAVPWRKIGYDAASLLDRMIEGERIDPTVIFVPPVGVVERQSTDVIAISDEDIVAAIRFIRDHAHEQIGVDDVLWAVPVARRSLEQRFRSVLRRTILEEIRRVHVERAKQLLAATDMSIKDVARSSGFGRGTWFSVSFRKLVGESPAQFRKRLHRE